MIHKRQSMNFNTYFTLFSMKNKDIMEKRYVWIFISGYTLQQYIEEKTITPFLAIKMRNRFQMLSYLDSLALSALARLLGKYSKNTK